MTRTHHLSATPKTYATRGSFPAGAGTLGLKPANSLDFVKLVNGGLPFQALARFQRTTGLRWEEVASFIAMPLRTLARRQASGRLRAEESDRLVQAAALFEMATGLFEGDSQAALNWLHSSQPALGGAVPMAFASTTVGAREVENVLLRLEHGVFT